MSNSSYFSIDRKNRLLEDSVTNESLKAIVSSLNLHQEDSVLTIYGSGDQAFAILEKVNRIVIVDYRPEQIKYFLRRKALLESGEFGMFLNPEQKPICKKDVEIINSRNGYFSDERLKRIKFRLKDSEIITKVGDLFQSKFRKPEFNKMYLSNILSYSLEEARNIELVRKRLKKLRTGLKMGGLIYMADYRHTIGRELMLGYYKNAGEILFPLGLEINLELSQNAQKLQDREELDDPLGLGSYWGPAVLEKIN